MTPRYYHTPSSPNSTRLRCPVCHETVYSKAGLHPQCAVRQSEKPEPKGEMKSEVKIDAKELPDDSLTLPNTVISAVMEET